MAEIDLAALLPADALAPFAEELRARERRRERRSQVRAFFAASCHSPKSAYGVNWSVRLQHVAAVAQEEAKRAARDAARKAAALAASMGPTAAELKVRARARGVDIVRLSLAPEALIHGWPAGT